MFTKQYWKRLFEDAVSFASASALAVLGVDMVNATLVDWATVGGVALGAAVVAVLKGLTVKKINDSESPRMH